MTDRIDLSSWIDRITRLDPDAQALHFEGEWRPWAYCSNAVDELSRILDDHGLGPGSAIGVIMRNRPEIVRTVVALLATSRCVATLSSVVPGKALADDVRKLGLAAVVGTARDWTEELTEAAAAAGSLGLEVGDRRERTVERVRVERQSEAPPTLMPGIAVQMLSSGTTGPPKRVDLRYASLEHELASTASYSAGNALSEPRLRSGVSILWAPLLHIGGLRSLISTTVTGRRIALLERFEVEPWRLLVEEHRPKLISLAPAAVKMVLDAQVPPATMDGVRAVMSGTAPLDPAIAGEFERRYGVPILVVYGATEFAGGVAGWTLKDWEEYGEDKRGSVGRANAGIDVRVIDPETSDVLPTGQDGLLEVRGPQLAEDGWLRTTDLARIDGDGFIWILGRTDDVVIRGGLKVSTTQVREVLVGHPSVEDAAVVGVADPRLGQVPVAAVEGRSGGPTPDPVELRDYLRRELSAYQVPVEIRVLDELPRTPSMKVRTGAVRDLFEIRRRPAVEP